MRICEQQIKTKTVPEFILQCRNSTCNNNLTNKIPKIIRNIFFPLFHPCQMSLVNVHLCHCLFLTKVYYLCILYLRIMRQMHLSLTILWLDCSSSLSHFLSVPFYTLILADMLVLFEMHKLSTDIDIYEKNSQTKRRQRNEPNDKSKQSAGQNAHHFFLFFFCASVFCTHGAH